MTTLSSKRYSRTCLRRAQSRRRGAFLLLILFGCGTAVFVPATTEVQVETVGPASTPPPESSRLNVYRFEDHLSDAVLSESAPPVPDMESTIQAWPTLDASGVPLATDGTAAVEGGVLKFKSEGKGTITFPENLGIYTPSAESLELRLRVSGPANLKVGWRYRLLSWEEMEEIQNCTLSVPVTSDNEPHTYVIRLDNMEAWRQYRTVDGLRLITEEAAAIEIEGAAIHQRQGLFAGAGIGTREYAIRGETRQVVYMHTPARLACRVTVPENPVLATGLAQVMEGNPVQFTVTLTKDGQQSVLFEKRIEETDAWAEQRIELGGYEGEEVELELSAKADAPGQIALWSTPVLYDALQKNRSWSRPNIIVYLVDALRADHLNPYGYTEPTSPNLARFAEKGITFENCFSQETCTKPSVMTLHTGIDRIAHGFICNEGMTFTKDPVFYPTLLREMGYTTCAISQNSYGPPVSFTQNAFCRLVELHEVDRSVTEDTYKAVATFFEEHQDRPFYMYIHTMECHEQWTPSPEHTSCAAPEPLAPVWKDPTNASRIQLYDGSIAFADCNFERIRAKLHELGLLENTLIIFTSDHGYALGERGEWEHGKAPYLDQIHIPLILSWPAGPFAAGRIAENVQTADISATILDLAGLPNLEISQGTSLVSLMRGAKEPFLERPVFSSDGWSTSASAIRGHFRLHKDREGKEYLYDLAQDPPESRDLAADRPDLVAELHQELKAHTRQNSKIAETIRNNPDSKQEIAVDPVKLEILKSLGYLGE